MDVLLVLAAYLLGSVNFPILAGRLRGWDIRERDMAGASGVFRQLGAGWGVAVLALEIGKGALAALLVLQSPNEWLLPFGAGAVVAGHLWPVFHGFRGGGGLACAGGFALAAFPAQALVGVGVFGLMIGVYFLIFKRDTTKGLGALPFAAIFGFAYLLFALWGRPEAFFATLAMVAVMGFRGVMVLLGRWW